jgi:hypothetical protein
MFILNLRRMFPSRHAPESFNVFPFSHAPCLWSLIPLLMSYGNLYCLPHHPTTSPFTGSPSPLSQLKSHARSTIVTCEWETPPGGADLEPGLRRGRCHTRRGISPPPPQPCMPPPPPLLAPLQPDLHTPHARRHLRVDRLRSDAHFSS